MKRAEFIQGFVTRRWRSYQQSIKAGQMRESEAAMGMVDAEKDAIRLWRKHAASYRLMTYEQIWPGAILRNQLRGDK